MGYLTCEEILTAPDLVYEDVSVPEWGGTVRVRGLTGTERDALEGSIVEQRGKKTSVNMTNLRAKLIVNAVVDGDGKRVFTSKDVDALGQKSAQALQRVFEVAQRLSGLSSDDVEELTKNLSGDQGDDSTSA